VRVPVGGSVVWTNNDNQPHTATSSGLRSTIMTIGGVESLRLLDSMTN
jgi:plastocyanin